MTSWWTWDRVLRALILGLALATIGSFFGDQAWWLDILADFKTQSVIGAVLLLLAALATRRMKEAVLTLALLIINGTTLTPYLVLPPEGQATMKIVGFNINNHNLDTALTLDFLRRESADVVVVTEVTETWQKAFEQLSSVYPHRFYGPAYQGPGDEPHRIGLLAKRAWEETGVEWSNLTSRAFAIWARFPAASPSLTVAGVHLLNPVYRLASDQRAEAEALVSAVNRFDGPVVVTGDFNMTPFSTRYGNLLRNSNLRRATGGLNATWPALLTPLGLSLDHVLVGEEVSHASMRTGPRLGSDHLPVVGTFDLGK